MRVCAHAWPTLRRIKRDFLPRHYARRSRQSLPEASVGPTIAVRFAKLSDRLSDRMSLYRHCLDDVDALWLGGRTASALAWRYALDSSKRRSVHPALPRAWDRRACASFGIRTVAEVIVG